MEPSLNQWSVWATYRPNHREADTHPYIICAYSGEREDLARAEFERRANPLNSYYVMQVELTCNGSAVASWDEQRALDERQRVLRAAELAALINYEQKEEHARVLGTAEAYGEEGVARRAYELAQKAFSEAIFLSPQEYEAELAIRVRYAPNPARTSGLHGHPELSTNGGNMFWRGTYVDSFWDPYTMDVEAHQLSAHCHHLEAIGVPVSFSSYINGFDWFRVMGPDHSYKLLLVHLCCSFWQHSQTGELAFVGVQSIPGTTVLYYDTHVWHRIWWERDPEDYRWTSLWDYHPMVWRGWELVPHPEDRRQFLHNAPLHHVVAWLATHGIRPDFLDEQSDRPWCVLGQACQWCQRPVSPEE